MTVRLITYDLNKESSRPPIVKAIKSDYDSWAKLSESSYAVLTSKSPKTIYEELSEHLDSNDNLYVVALSRPYFGQGPQAVNDWLEKNL